MAQFRAQLKRVSAIRRTWLSHHRISGQVAGVLFRHTQTDDFVSEVLEPAEIEALAASPDVEISVVGAPVPANARVLPEDDADADGDVAPAPRPPSMPQVPARPIPPSAWAKPPAAPRKAR